MRAICCLHLSAIAILNLLACVAVDGAERDSKGGPAPTTPIPIRFEPMDVPTKPVVDFDHPDLAGNQYGFEGGMALKLDDAYHIFTAEMAGDPYWYRMRLAHWTSRDGKTWKRLGTIKETTGVGADGPQFSIWAPMAIYSDADKQWNLFWVGYYNGSKYGSIIRAVSLKPGKAGIDGPWKELGAMIKTDDKAQAWEGEQGVDSFFPFPVKSGWLAFYGSHKFADGSPWQNGLMSAPALSGPWVRLAKGNPVPLERTFSENPIVTPVGNLLMAVYDSIDESGHGIAYRKEGTSVGLSWSKDGIVWAQGARIVVAPPGKADWSSDIRTPLGLIPEGNSTYTLFYTAESKSRKFFPIGMIRLRAVGK